MQTAIPTQQHLSPKSITVMRDLLAAHPTPISGTKLNTYALPRLTNNEPPLVRMVPAERNGRSTFTNAQPCFELTDYGLTVARAIPADLPDNPTRPILLDVESGQRLPIAKPTHPAAEAVSAEYPPAQISAPQIEQTALQPALTPLEDNCPTDPHACESCPVKSELDLLYTLFPQLRATVAPIIALQRALGGK